jgi:hypothetical protein
MPTTKDGMLNWIKEDRKEAADLLDQFTAYAEGMKHEHLQLLSKVLSVLETCEKDSRSGSYREAFVNPAKGVEFRKRLTELWRWVES